MRPTCHHIPSMLIGIDEAGYHHRLPLRLRHIWWKLFSDVSIKVTPVCVCVEYAFINVRRFWVEYNSSTVFVFLEISEYVV